MLFDLLVGKDTAGKARVIKPPGTIFKSGRFRVTQEFGCPRFRDEPQLKDCHPAPFHRGIDISDGKCNSPVFAAHAGKVRFAGEVAVAGADRPEKLVVLNHFDGWGSSYGHLNSIAVEDGERVDVGQKIGTIGDTGNADACHLHYAIKSGLPAGWTRRDFFPVSGDAPGRGRWRNPWPLLMQNVTIHPRIDRFEINIRSVPELGKASRFARTKPDGTIRRTADDADLGRITEPRRYGGRVTGAEYDFGDGISGTDWDLIKLDGEFRFIAAPLAKLSAT
jgi:murein DD-endopeptidase MepM/ murein hydrolase activator NlpD